MRYSCSLDDKYKFSANVRGQGPQNHQNTSFYKHSNVTFNIQMLHTAFNSLFKCRTFIYALVCICVCVHVYMHPKLLITTCVR